MKGSYLIPLITLIWFSCVTDAQGQAAASVGGLIHNPGKSPLEAITVTLHRLADSGIAKIDLSDQDGRFQLTELSAGSYFIRITAIGFSPFESEPFSLAENTVRQVDSICLYPGSIELAAVDVVANKPLLDVRHDRTIVNVDQLLSAQGGSAFDLLKQSPGLTMNQDGAISIRGKQNVLVQIDGRQTFMTGADLTEYLRGLSADQLDQIEIITQPSAKYDAAGTGGIINLKTKKGQQQGINTKVTLGARQGRYFNSGNNIDVNWKTSNVNISLNYGYVLDRPLIRIDQQNLFENEAGITEAIVVQDFKSIATNHTHNVRSGLGYTAGRTTVGLTYTGTFVVYPTQTNTTFSDIFDAQTTPVATNNSARGRKSRKPMRGINLYMHQDFGNKGQELSIVADYLAYNRSLVYNLTNTYTDLNEPTNNQFSQIRQEIPSDIDIYGIKADYVYPVADDIKLEVGFKSTFMKMDNNALFQLYDAVTQRYETDADRSVHYLFDENINAAYINYHQQLGESLEVQVGLRMENTRNNGEEANKAERFDRRYTQFFPVATLNYQASDKHALSVGYNRRINRPTYLDLIPYAYYTDLLYYQVGNPRLRPELVHNVDLAHTFADKVTTSFNYAHISDVLSGVFRTQPGSPVLEEGFANVATKNSYGISVDYSEEITPWYTLSSAVTVSYNHFSGALADEPINVGRASWLGQLTNQFSFGESWSVELLANYQSSMQEDAISVLHQMGQVDVTVGKQVLDNKGSLRFLLIDAFNTGRYSYDSQLGKLTSDFKLRFDNRMIGLSFSYRFGSGKGSAKREQRSSTDEEVGRL